MLCHTRFLTVFGVSVVGYALGCDRAIADGPMPGLYSVTMEMESDMPMPAQNQTSTQCLTEDDFNEDPELMEESEDCQVDEYVMADGKMRLVMRCNGDQGDLSMTSDGVYDDTSFSFVSTMQMTAQGMTVNMTARNSGQRVGDCAE